MLGNTPLTTDEIECSILGSMIMDSECITIAIDMLRPENFNNILYRDIYKAIISLHDKHNPVNEQTVAQLFVGRRGKKEIRDAICSMMAVCNTPAHVRYFATQLLKKATLRELINTSSKIIEMANDPNSEMENTLDYAQEQMVLISNKVVQGDFISIASLKDEAMSRLAKACREHNSITGVATGFSKLDEMTGGLQRADLVILAARPSQGKTAMALDVIINACVFGGKPVAFFSLEMDRHAIYNRMLCSISKVDVSKIRGGFIRDNDMVDMDTYSALIGNAPLWIDDSSNLDIMDIRARARKLQATLKQQGKEIGLIVIDYLQLIRSIGKRDNRQQEITEISRLLKDMAKTLQVPVLALSQLNRKSEERDGNRPMLSDLRESGSLEQDADVVCLIHRPEYYNHFDPTLKNRATVIIGKQRNGPVGDVELLFFPEYTRFDNPAKAVPKSEDYPSTM